MKRVYASCLMASLMLASVFLLSCKEDVPLVITGSISGTVIDAATEQPLSGVNVYISPSGLTSLTDNNGHYEFSDITAGQYSVQFVKNGYISNTKQVTVIAEKITSGDCSLSQGDIELKLNVSELNFGATSNMLAFRIENISSIRSFMYEISNIPSCINISSTSGTLNAGKSVEIIVNLNRNNITNPISEAIIISAGGTTISLPIKILATSARVDVRDYLSISDGIYCWLTPSSNVNKFYWDIYAPNELPQNDEAIIDKLLTNDAWPINEIEGWGYDLQEQTTYTVCLIAFDAQQRRGELVKKEITTKSSINQPVAKLSIDEFLLDGELLMSTRKNAYCHSYITDGYMISIDVDDYDYDYWMNLPDIYYAATCYENYKKGYVEYADIENGPSYWLSNYICVTFSMGFDKTGRNSGVIDKIYFSTETNSIIFPKQPVLRQTNAGLINKRKLRLNSKIVNTNKR